MEQLIYEPGHEPGQELWQKLRMLVCAAACSCCGINANAAITVEVTQGVEQAKPIAIVPFSAALPLPEDVAAIVSADLLRSGRFAPMAVSDMPGQPDDFNQVQFDDWRRLEIENLVVGKVGRLPDGQYEAEFRLIDVYRAKQMDGRRIVVGDADLRLAAHRIADLVYEALTQIPGAFSTRISYITVHKGRQSGKVYSLEVADADGYNTQTLLTSPEPLMSPAWSPDGRRLAYVSFEGHASSIFVQDIFTGARNQVASGQGINSAPAWSPDGRKLAITSSRDGNPEIYVLELASGSLSRLTRDQAIDTEPAWSPDGRRLVFTSDRGGSPQIYEMDLYAQGNPQRITLNMGEYNARASYSADGKLLTMVHRDSAGYRIAVLDRSARVLNVISNTRMDESPSFAPNGSMIIYATVGSRGTELAATSTDGRVHQRLAGQGGEVREPAWGPFRK